MCRDVRTSVSSEKFLPPFILDDIFVGYCGISPHFCTEGVSGFDHFLLLSLMHLDLVGVTFVRVWVCVC